MCVLGVVCCAICFYNSALQVAGEAVVKRDLDCSKFSEIARYLLWHKCFKIIKFSITITSVLTPLNKCLYFLLIRCVSEAYPRA